MTTKHPHPIHNTTTPITVTKSKSQVPEPNIEEEEIEEFIYEPDGKEVEFIFEPDGEEVKFDSIIMEPEGGDAELIHHLEDG